MTYAGGKGVIVHDLELICLTGQVALNAAPTISTAYSGDGVTWSQDKYVPAGKIGDRIKRVIWRQQGFLRNWRVQRFQGTSDARVSVLALEATLEPMVY